MNERRMRFRLGLFVLGALVLLAVLVILFRSLPPFFATHNTYFIRFADAPGVGQGTPVRRSGVRIGEVSRVVLEDDTGDVVVSVLIEAGRTVRRNERPTLVHGLLAGDTTIDFIPAPPIPGQEPDRSVVPPRTELVGVRQATVSTLLNRVSDVVPPTDEAMREFRDLLKETRTMLPEFRRTNDEFRALARSVNESVPDLRRTNDEIQVAARNFGRLGERVDTLLQANQDKLVKALDNLNDTLMRVASVFSDENQRNLAATLRNVKAGSDNLESITKNTDELVKESRVTVKRVGDSVARAEEVLDNLQKTTRPMAERSGSVMKNLDESTAKLNLALNDVRDLLRAVGQADGALPRLLSDPTLYNRLDDAACLLVRLIPRVERILKDVEVFADKIARHPESLGVGGVVSPSSGRK